MASDGRKATKEFDFVVSGEGDKSRIRDIFWTSAEVAQQVAFARYFALIPRPRAFPARTVFEQMSGLLLPFIFTSTSLFLFFYAFYSFIDPFFFPKFLQLLQNHQNSPNSFSYSPSGSARTFGGVAIGETVAVWGSRPVDKVDGPKALVSTRPANEFLECFAGFGGAYASLLPELNKV